MRGYQFSNVINGGILPKRGDLLSELPSGFPAMVSSATEPLPRGDMKLACYCTDPSGTGIETGRPSLESGRPRTRAPACPLRRLKNGTPATHPLTGKELRALRRLQRKQEPKSPFVFTSERGTPYSRRGIQAMVERAGEAAKFDMKIHAHMLRHACGFKLANDGVDTRTIQAYLGHKSIQHTVRYTELAPTRFKSLFRD